MLATGTQAPDFTLTDQDGNPFTLSEALAAQRVLLYFYPADFTPGCTKEACMLRDRNEELMEVGVRVVGVSPQGEDSHQRFRAQHSLPFTLLCDADKSVVRQYDLDGPLGIGVRRGTFLIEQDGTISDAVLADLRISRHEGVINAALSRATSA